MSRLQSIENSLKSINEAVFQELCDSFLILRNPGYAAFNRTGSHSGKQKSIKGTPDSLLLLPGGRYMMVEYSTNITKGISKLREDILKCLHEESTGIPVKDISEIVLCVNFNLRNDEIVQLNALLNNTTIDLVIYTLDAMSIELHLNHRDLVNRYLGLPVDTGQVVSMSQFIEEYNNAYNSIATPLDNPFLHRSGEMAALTSALAEEDFIILTGPAGIGKTRLALEGIKAYLAEHPACSAFCISYKNSTLFSDLQQNLHKDRDYILFVDDANRIDAFSQILGFSKESRTGVLKIIITVRDYAFHDMKKMTNGLKIRPIEIHKLTDEQIKDIISVEPWNITNPMYHDTILAIADGNPRLAIMTAQLAIAEQNIAKLYDVSELFDTYFGTFVQDKDEAEGALKVKVLGLIAFFYTLPYKNREVIVPILEKFGITYAEFADSIDTLDKLELVDVQFDHVKIPEQNLATFFFFRAFIKTSELSLGVLVENYFESNVSRLRESIISTNNTFGPERVMNAIRPTLQAQLRNLEAQGRPLDKFLTSFWFYLKVEVMEHLLKKFMQMEDAPPQRYRLTYETNEFAYDKDPTIAMLGNFFHYPDQYLKDAIELSFMYVRKQPGHLPELIHKIRETLGIDRNDQLTGYYRQHTLFNFLISRLEEGDTIPSLAFFELAGTFLQFSFQQTRGARNNAIQFYTITLQNNKATRSFRKRLWDTLDLYFPLYTQQAFGVLKSYGKRSPDVEPRVMKSDLVYVCAIISKHLTPTSFEHCKYVQEQFRWFKRKNTHSEDIAELKQRFTNPVYRTYLKLDWDMLRGKEDDGLDYKLYEAHKETEVREAFVFSNEQDMADFYQVYKLLKETMGQDRWNYERSLDIIADENLYKDFGLGCKFLAFIIERQNEIGYQPWMAFRKHLDTEDKVLALWKIITQNEFPDRDIWEMNFYEQLSVNPFGNKLEEHIASTLTATSKPLTVHLDRLTRHTRKDSGFSERIIRLIVVRNEIESVGLRLWMTTFEDGIEYLGEDMELLKTAYLQQDQLQSHFDYQGKGLKKILEKDATFLLSYVKSLYSDERHRYDGRGEDLTIVWELEGFEPVLTDTFDMVAADETYFGIGEHFCNCFFRRFDDVLKKRKAQEFLLAYTRTYNNDRKKMNIVVDISRHTMREAFEPVLLQHAVLNQDAELFASIYWRGNGGVVSGDANMGDMEAAEWQNILSIISRLDLGLKLIPIKRYLTERIESAVARGDWERQRRFTERY